MSSDTTQTRTARSWLDHAQVAGLASVGAGAIHLAAAGIHAEHATLARLFVLLGAAQFAGGLVLALAGGRWPAFAVSAVNTAAVVGWLLTRTTGIASIGGLEEPESPQFADTACALLGTIAIALALRVVARGGRRAPRSGLVAPGVVVGIVSVAAMLTGATHVHSHDDAGHEHPPGDAVPATDGVASEGDGHVHEAREVDVHDDHDVHDHAATDATWPHPWDPSGPIDFAGVPGVTTEQQARAESLVASTVRDLPRFSDVASIGALGFRSIGDAGTGFEHFINPTYVVDDSFLDPARPESLVYRVDGDERTLVSAMFIATDMAVDDPQLVGWGGPLMQWHVHENLCWKLGERATPVIAGVTDASGRCAPGTVNAGGRLPMVHVWIVPHACGPFAALEGHGAGQTAGDQQRTDQCAHDHTTGSGTGSDDPTTSGPTPFDPSEPVDLSGIDGVTPEQQAFAEDLVTRTMAKLPQWSDPAVAEAAGFRSIGDAATGHEHYVHWQWLDDDVTLDPDHPESLVYEPRPDGTKRLVSAMYMLPKTVTLADVPDWGGRLMQWHVHDNLCYTDDPVAPQVVGLTDPDADCRPPLVKHPERPMIHVWISPNPCGPFASLEGVAAGTIEAGQQRWCDHVHGD